MNTKKFSIRLALLAGLLNLTPAWSAIFTYSAIGTDNIPEGFTEDPSYIVDLSDPSANFFQIHFVEGLATEFITKISIDLQAGTDNDAFFDPSDANSTSDLNGGGKGFGPVIGSETLGLIESDVTFSLSPTSGTSAVLEILFASGSFAVNDILSFGIDIDLLSDSANDNLGNQAGGLLGAKSVGITTELEGSCESLVTSTFEQKSRNRSESLIEICQPSPAPSIPEPNSISLIMCGLLSFLFLTRKTNKISTSSPV